MRATSALPRSFDRRSASVHSTRNSADHGATVRWRKLGKRRHRNVRRKFDSGGKRLGDEAVEVIVVCRRNGMAGGKELGRIHARRVARARKRLPFERILVGLVEQHRKLRL